MSEQLQSLTAGERLVFGGDRVTTVARCGFPAAKTATRRPPIRSCS